MMKLQEIDTKSTKGINLFMFLVTVMASHYLNLVFEALSVEMPKTTLLAMKAFVIALAWFCTKWFSGNIRKVGGFTLILLSILGLDTFQHYLMLSKPYMEFFDQNTFQGLIGGNVILKSISAMIIILLLSLSIERGEKRWIRIGDLNIKACAIDWLGIKDNQITWLKLSVVSGVMISFGTIFLTWITVIGSEPVLNFESWFKLIPAILILAALNAFAEGVIFRLAIIAPLANLLSKKKVILMSAVIFGSYHYNGAPGGLIGVAMSTVLGWFMARSMYETKGLFSSWLIHVMQDVVIFSTLVLFGNF